MADKQTKNRGTFALGLVLFSVPTLFFLWYLAYPDSNPTDMTTLKAAELYGQAIAFVLLPATLLLAIRTKSAAQRIKAVLAGGFSFLFAPMVSPSIPFLFLGLVFLASYIEQESPSWHKSRDLSNPFLWSRFSMVALLTIIFSMFFIPSSAGGFAANLYLYLPLVFFVTSLVGIGRQLVYLSPLKQNQRVAVKA